MTVQVKFDDPHHGWIDDICRPFWRALRDLQGRLGDDDICLRRHRPFPTDIVERLTQRLQRHSTR